MLAARRILSTVAAILVLASVARAGAMRLEYSGVVTRAGSASGVAPGDRFSGTLSYVQSDRDGHVYIPGFTQYSVWKTGDRPEPSYTVNAGSGFKAGAGGTLTFRLMQGPPDQVENPPSVLRFDATGGPGISLVFRNDDRAVFPDAMNPIPAPTSIQLSDFPSATFSYGVANGGPEPDPTLTFSGTIDSVSLATLPSPTPPDPAGETDPAPPGATDPVVVTPTPTPAGDPMPIPEPSACLAMLGLAAFLVRRSRRD